MTNPTGEETLKYLLDAGQAQYPVEVKWGKGYRNVVMFKGKKYPYKGSGKINKRLLKSILPLYISMSSNTQNKNTYINSLVAKFKDVDKSLKENSFLQISQKKYFFFLSTVSYSLLSYSLL